MGTKIQYIKDDAALEDFRKKTSKKFDLGRMKGLGEMDYEELAETVMSEETRTLKQITMEDMNAASKVFIELMGESVTGRKKFIEENAWRANIDV
jgi:DNA gyrase subunit B